MKCYSYLTDSEYTQALIRLTKMIRGMGDPLVACYARAYLCRVGMSLAPGTKTHLLPNFTDYLTTLSQVSWVGPRVMSLLSSTLCECTGVNVGDPYQHHRTVILGICYNMILTILVMVVSCIALLYAMQSSLLLFACPDEQ